MEIHAVQQYRRIGLYGTVILLLRAWWQCRNRSSGWAITARPPPRPARGSSTNPAGGGAEVAPMPRPAREIGGTTAATPAERRRSCSVAGLVAPILQAVWPLTKPILTRCQCCGCMDCSSGTAAMRCDFKSQQLRALSSWNATNLWLALARLAGCDAFVRVETCGCSCRLRFEYCRDKVKHDSESPGRIDEIGEAAPYQYSPEAKPRFSPRPAREGVLSRWQARTL